MELFIIGLIVYVVLGIGTSKTLGALNRHDSSWDGGSISMSFIAWPIALFICAFWNFKK